MDFGLDSCKIDSCKNLSLRGKPLSLPSNPCNKAECEPRCSCTLALSSRLRSWQSGLSHSCMFTEVKCFPLLLNGFPEIECFLCRLDLRHRALQVWNRTCSLDDCLELVSNANNPLSPKCLSFTRALRECAALLGHRVSLSLICDS